MPSHLLLGIDIIYAINILYEQFNKGKKARGYFNHHPFPWLLFDGRKQVVNPTRFITAGLIISWRLN